MEKFRTMKTGFIVLEHDLYPQTVDAAIAIINKAVNVKDLNITTVPQCIGDNNLYFEDKNRDINKKPTNPKKVVSNDTSTESTPSVSAASLLLRTNYEIIIMCLFPLFIYYT